jgi:ligand-binding sensor domain-containing protein
MRFLQSILSSFICLIAASQTIIPRFETFGVNEGLSQNSVYAILQDKEGFMWFSTADGLNRYDGDEIKVYKTKPDFEKSRNSNFIRGRLCEDDKKNIWFSTETGIYFYDRLDDIVKPGYLFTQQKTDVYYYYLISCDMNNTLWLYNRHSAIISWNIKSGILKSYPFPDKTDVTKLSFIDYNITDPSGNIWISWHQNDGMLKFDTKEKKFIHEFKGRNYQVIVFSKG